METVTVGDPGNTPDDEVMWTDGTTGYGGVDYVYNIGKYEVTNAQYCEVLNAVAASDPHGLYNTNMGSGYGGITRDGSQGSYTYSTIAGRANMPVIYVGWYDALRFANWLHNGQPTGAQDASTTEDGAYDMSLSWGVVRKPGARVFLPSEDEWYKAAYYKGSSTSAGYWDYPTETDDPDPPTAEAPPGSDLANGSANYESAVGGLTDVGAYAAKPSNSASGTFDQGGNVWEWNEADIFGYGSHRGLRGGSYDFSYVYLHAAARYGISPAAEDYDIGFRVAEVPVLDFNGDGTVDLYDFASLQAEFGGDVDLHYFDWFRENWTGPSP
jgi:formylglycine-generating enzyme required for sulfatase activity